MEHESCWVCWGRHHCKGRSNMFDCSRHEEREVTDKNAFSSSSSGRLREEEDGLDGNLCAAVVLT